MKEYEFQYTPLKNSFIAGLLIAIAVILTATLGAYNHLNVILIYVLTFGVAFFIFKIFKQRAVHNCIARLNDTSVTFEFENNAKTFSFDDLFSYKAYYGKNGPILYLKTKGENFKIFANNNFCKTDDFKLFCDDIILQLDRYKEKYNSTIIHEGSAYATKGFLYFLVISTCIYLVAFLLERKDLIPYIGIGGGVYLLILWIAYFNKRNLKSK